jgi:hypothetical protein
MFSHKIPNRASPNTHHTNRTLSSLYDILSFLVLTPMLLWAFNCLRNTLISAPRVVACTVGEKPVDNQANNGEDEDDHTPEDLVERWAIGFENLHCK